MNIYKRAKMAISPKTFAKERKVSYSYARGALNRGGAGVSNWVYRRLKALLEEFEGLQKKNGLTEKHP